MRMGGMDEQQFAEAAIRLDRIRKQKKELEDEEKQLKQELITYMEERGLEKVPINEQQAVHLQQRVQRRDFDVTEASRVLPPNLFQDVLTIHSGKIQEMVKEGTISEEQYRRILIKEYLSTYIVIR